MSFEDWIFSLHLLTAATLVGGLVMSWIVVVALRSVDAADATLSLNRVADGRERSRSSVGLLGTIGLGIWIAILRPQLHPWHGWAIGSDRPLGDRDGRGAALVRRVREARREGQSAHRVRPDRPERRARRR